MDDRGQQWGQMLARPKVTTILVDLYWLIFNICGYRPSCHRHKSSLLRLQISSIEPKPRRLNFCRSLLQIFFVNSIGFCDLCAGFFNDFS